MQYAGPLDHTYTHCITLTGNHIARDGTCSIVGPTISSDVKKLAENLNRLEYSLPLSGFSKQS